MMPVPSTSAPGGLASRFHPDGAAATAARRYPALQTVERHLQRMGAKHVEGCGEYEDHHMFTLEELAAAIR